MSDTAILHQILARLTGLEDGQKKLEDGQKNLEDGQKKLERKVDGQQRWFETINQKVDGLEQTVTALRGEVGEVRDLMVHLREDDVVNRRAIANVSDDLDATKERLDKLEKRVG